MSTVVHFEIPADDPERARRFYYEMFGWQIEKIPGMEYWLINTTGENPIGGGLMRRESPKQTITNYIDVSSIDEFIEKTKSLGGKALVSKKAVPGMGYYAICLDPEGNTFGIWEDSKEAR